MNDGDPRKPESSELIGESQKNDRETIRVSVIVWHGQTFLDVRVHNEDGAPLMKGITAHPRCWRELTPILAAALEAVDSQGRGR